jgi:hypothetical protein
MEIKYYCHNCQCTEVLKKTYILTLKLESVMDEKNIAQMFCPHCKSELKAK